MQIIKQSTRVALLVMAAAIMGGPAAFGQVADWPDLYAPFQIVEIQITMDPVDLAIIQADETFEIEVPAIMRAPGEPSITVSIRRKSGDPIGGKLSYKIDINEYVDGQLWHGVRKLSLENGDDEDVVTEGFAWFLQQQAQKLNNGYVAGMASWATLTINGVSHGLYLNVEQVDETFLKNRGLWVSHETWLYKQSDIASTAMKEEPLAGTLVNTTMEALNYSPFAINSPTPTPDPQALVAELDQHIYMNTMLTQGAVEAIIDARDALFSKGKNFYFADYVNDRRRYFPWDLDSTVRSTTASIYQRGGTPWEIYILDNPTLRDRYDRIMLDLIDGPLDPQFLIAFLDQLEPVLTPALQADPNSKIGDDVPGHFESLRRWSTERMANVRTQLPAIVHVAGDADGDGDVDLDDFVILKGNFGVVSGASRATGDFDGDGDVDLEDFVILKSNFGATQ